MAIQHMFHTKPVPQSSSLAKQQSPLLKLVKRLGDFLLEYWAHIITVSLGLLVFAAIVVPFLSYVGLDAISKPIFFALHYVCAQIPSHSFYIYGHQLGLCARNFSIYTSMFIGSLVFVLSKKRFPGIPWYVWILMLLPMAWDGLTQMFGLRESDWILRAITGTLFGLGNVWFVLPLMQKSLLETPLPPQAYQRLQQGGRVPTYAVRSEYPPYPVQPYQPSVNVTPIAHVEASTEPVMPTVAVEQIQPSSTSPSTQAGYNAL